MKNYFLLFIVSLISHLAFSQPPPPSGNCPTIVFTYDANGNRIQRDLVIVPCGLRMGNTHSPKPLASSFNANVYPNPAKDKINIEVQQDSSANETRITLSDLAGKTVYAGTVAAAIVQIDVSTLSNGTYLLKIMRGRENKTYNVLKN